MNDKEHLENQSNRLLKFAEKIKMNNKKKSPQQTNRTSEKRTPNTETFLSLKNQRKTSKRQNPPITIHNEPITIHNDNENENVVDNDFTKHMDKALEALEKNIDAKNRTKKNDKKKEKDCSLEDCSISGGRKFRRTRNYKKKHKKLKSRKFRKNVYK